MRQTNRIKNLEINLHIYSQLTYDTGNTELQWGKGGLFNQLKMNLNPYLIPYRKINLRWIRDLNVKGKITKLLERNRRLSS